MHQYGMHDNGWLMNSSTGRAALALMAEGYTFDLISDAQIELLRMERGALLAPGGRYRLIVVPAVKRMPVTTLAKLSQLQRRGAELVFESLPADVPGLAHLDARRAELRKLLAQPLLLKSVATHGLSVELAARKVRREPAASAGLAFVRRARADGCDYFIANLAAKAFDGWLELGTPAASALLLDPLSARIGVAATQRADSGNTRVYLQLESGESMMVRTRNVPVPAKMPAWPYVARVSPALGLEAGWQVDFIKGGPALPRPAQLQKLASWTGLDDPDAQRFAGTARYSIQFDAPANAADDWLLELGDVRESARVSLNGRPLANAWSLPFSVRLGASLRPKGNELKIEVSNLPANRIRDLDMRKVDWKIMQDINLASIRYKALDASGWELAPSGLLGPVRLVPLKVVSPR
jgi:hypothetical protein